MCVQIWQPGLPTLQDLNQSEKFSSVMCMLCQFEDCLNIHCIQMTKLFLFNFVEKI